jgi:predicted nucleic acid-binding protein
MNLVDSCGWLEYFADGPNAAFFAQPLEDIDNVLVPTICILEVFKKLLQQRGEDEALQAAAIMQQCHVTDLNVPAALQAGKLSAQTGLPLAESVVLATARQYNAIIWTQDSDFKGFDKVKYREKRK